MFTRTTTSRALGALFGLTAMLSSMLAPAYAAAPAADQVNTLAASATTVQSTTRTETLDQLFFQPDVRVLYLGSYSSNGKRLYRFRVENIGAASADNVYIDEAVHQVTFDGSIGADQSIGGQKIAYLGADQSVEVKVSCTPKPGYRCAGASATAMLPDDLDTSNNHAHS
jgi:hypothetical protein